LLQNYLVYIRKLFVNTIAWDSFHQNEQQVAVADIRCAILHHFAQCKDLLAKALTMQASNALLNWNLQWRIEVDALLSQNPPKGLAVRKKNPVIVYKEES
jgi:hypothetical protein